MKEAINVWERRRISGVAMPRDELLKEVENFILQRANCSLATGYGTYIRNTPMRYSYRDGKFIFITEGGLKFKGLFSNPHVSLAIYDVQDVSSDTVGLTVEGKAFVTEFKTEQDQPADPTRFMITVTPTLMDYLNSSLLQRGYFQLQRLTFDV